MRAVEKYGEVGRQDAEDLLQRIQDQEAGETDTAENTAESNTPATER